MNLSKEINFNGHFRGKIIDNTGPKGRCKIFIKGIYPQEYEDNAKALPWAEPALSLFGGNFTTEISELDEENSSPLTVNETGICGWPEIGAFVWVFFERHNHLRPIYFASVQAGSGWQSEHNKQWTLKTPNLRIRIDENPGKGTSKFDSYNEQCTHLSIPQTKSQMPTLIDIEAEGNINIIVKGNVNLKTEGTLYKEHTGDIHETLIGNLYRKHVGDTHEEIKGTLIREVEGDISESIKGEITLNKEGNKLEQIVGNLNTSIDGVETLSVTKQYTESITNKISNIQKLNQCTVVGKDIKTVEGDMVFGLNGNFSGDISSNGSSTKGKMNLKSSGPIGLGSGSDIILNGKTIRLN